MILLVGKSHHRVSLAATGLPVCKDRTVVAPNDGLDEWKGCFIVNLPLCRIDSVYGVIGENFLFWSTFFVRTHNNLVRRLVNITNANAS